MHKAISLMAALLFVGAAQPTASEPMKKPVQPMNSPAKTAQAESRPVLIRTALHLPRDADSRLANSRGQIASCANLAAVRALDAKAVGASYAAQDRILELTFVLCMSGPETRD